MPQQKAGRLRPAQAFAAAIGHHVRSMRQVDVGHLQFFRRRVHQDGHLRGARNAAGVFDAQRPLFGSRTTHDENHRRLRPQCRCELLLRIDVYDPGTSHARRVVIDVAGITRHDHFAFQPDQVREPLHLFRIGSGNAGGRGMRNRGRTASRDNAPLGLGQFGNPRADRIHQFVHIDEVARGFGHGLLHRRQRLRAGQNREGAARVDKRPDPQ